MVVALGFEPYSPSWEDGVLSHIDDATIKLVAPRGIEPTICRLKVYRPIPIRRWGHYINWGVRRDSNPYQPDSQSGTLIQLCYIHHYYKLEPAVGIEPTTFALQKRCSTAELSWHKIMFYTYSRKSPQQFRQRPVGSALNITPTDQSIDFPSSHLIANFHWLTGGGSTDGVSNLP